MPSSLFAYVCATFLLLLLPSSVVSSSTEYKCPSGEYCTISSNESMCTPIGQGLPAGNVFMPTLMGSGASAPMPYACVGISTTDLSDGGGGCVVTCPDSCTVTPGVSSPCLGGFGSSITGGMTVQKCQLDGVDVPCDGFTSGGGSRVLNPTAMGPSLIAIAFALANI